MKKALITGGAGFIGGHLARAFVAAGWGAIALDNLQPQVHLDPQASVAAFPGEVVEGDVTDPTAWSSLPAVDVIVHLAAETGVGQSMYETERYRHVNVDGTRLAGLAAQRLGVPLVSFSSRAVYGQGRHECPRCGTTFGGPCCTRAVPAPSQESDPLAPVSVYGETKAEAERSLLEGIAGEIPVAIVRPQNVIGPGQALHNPYTGVLAAFLARLREGRPLNIYGDGRQTRDFVHVVDLAQLVLWLSVNPPAPGDPVVVNSGSGVRTTLLELAELAIEAAPVCGVPVEHLDVQRAGDIDHACADLGHSIALGAPQPTLSAADGVTDFIRWGWGRPGASAQAWDMALTELAAKGLTS